MGEAKNPFIARIDKGTIASEAELKRWYRRLAMHTHPDAAPAGNGEAFRRLKTAYDAALEHLRIRQPAAGSPVAKVTVLDGDWRPVQAGRCEFYRGFAELMAANLPSLLTPVDGRPMQARRRRELAAAHDRLRSGNAGGLDRAVAESARLQADGPKGQRLAGELRQALLHLASWHYYPSGFARQAIGREAARIGPALAAAGCPEAEAFVAWLVVDMENGAALE